MQKTIVRLAIVTAVLFMLGCNNNANVLSAKSKEAMMWPELPKSGYVSGRAATREDVSAGNAVFVLETNGVPIGTPLQLEIPQYAYHVDEETAQKTPGILIQAEEAQGNKIVGMRKLDGTEMAGLINEYELLGTKKPEI